ncbi:MAG: RpiB/LacA/LacB family sugar-phosphate isomerase, partial [Candidatus Acidiferrales bacterium]
MRVGIATDHGGFGLKEDLRGRLAAAGQTVSANKVPGARACLIMDHFSARQGVGDDHMNIICLGGRITGTMLASDLVEA